VSEVLSIPGWKDAMKVEMLALKQNETSDLAIFLPRRQLSVGVHCETKSRWVPSLFEARLVAKGYSEVYDIDYQDTSLVAKLTSMQFLISLVATHH